MEKNKALIISLSVVAGVLALSLIILTVFMVAGRGQEAGDASGAETSDENAAESGKRIHQTVLLLLPPTRKAPRGIFQKPPRQPQTTGGASVHTFRKQTSR